MMSTRILIMLAAVLLLGTTCSAQQQQQQQQREPIPMTAEMDKCMSSVEAFAKQELQALEAKIASSALTCAASHNPMLLATEAFGSTDKNQYGLCLGSCLLMAIHTHVCTVDDCFLQCHWNPNFVCAATGGGSPQPMPPGVKP